MSTPTIVSTTLLRFALLLALATVLLLSLCTPTSAIGNYRAGTAIGTFTSCLCSDSSAVLSLLCSVVQANITVVPYLGGVFPQRYVYECFNSIADSWSTVYGSTCVLTGSNCPSPSPTVSPCTVFDVAPGGNVKQIEIWTAVNGTIEGIQYTDNYGLSSIVCGDNTGTSTIQTPPVSIPNAPLGYVNWFFDPVDGSLTGMQPFWTI